MLALVSILGKRVDQLSLDDIDAIARKFGYDLTVTPDLRDAGLALLQGRNIHEVADLVKDPESIAALVELVSGQTKSAPIPETRVVRCPFCSAFHAIEIER